MREREKRLSLGTEFFALGTKSRVIVDEAHNSSNFCLAFQGCLLRVSEASIPYRDPREAATRGSCEGAGSPAGCSSQVQLADAKSKL